MSRSKLEFLKWRPILESHESPARFQNCAVHEVGMLLIVGILNFSHRSAIHSTTFAVIWKRKMPGFSARQFWSRAWVLSEKRMYESADQIAQGFASVLQLRHIHKVGKIHYKCYLGPRYASNRLYRPVQHIAFTHFICTFFDVGRHLYSLTRQGREMRWSKGCLARKSEKKSGVRVRVRLRRCNTPLP